MILQMSICMVICMLKSAWLKILWSLYVKMVPVS